MIIERVQKSDLDEVVLLWHECKRVAYPYLPLEQGRTLKEDKEYFCENILTNCDIWVAKEEEKLLGFIAVNGNWIDRLYVKVGLQAGGIGTALMNHAKKLLPEEIRLFTHQKNRSARAFYEKHGFKVVKYGISPPPESEPDVEYCWNAA